MTGAKYVCDERCGNEVAAADLRTTVAEMAAGTTAMVSFHTPRPDVWCEGCGRAMRWVPASPAVVIERSARALEMA
jgi:hypothetical protein